MSQETLATVFGISAVVLWSTVATAFKLGLAVYTPAQLLTLACAVSCVVFWLTALATRSVRLGRGDLAWALALGLLNPVLYYLVLFEAYDRLPAQIAQPLNYTWAIVLALLAVPVLKQRLSPGALAGIVLAYAGVVVLIYRDAGQPELSASGIALALGSTMLWAIYWLLNTKISAPPAAIMAYSFTFALPALAAWTHRTDGWPVSSEGWPYAVWVGLVEMGVTFVLWQQALKRTAHVARISQLIFLSPFLSLVLIGNVLGEPIRSTTVWGLAIIVAGVMITQRATGR